MRPALGAPAVDRNREILIHAHAVAELVRAISRVLELQRRLPLQVLIELDALAVRFGEARDFRRIGTTKSFRPDRPSPDRRILAVEVLLQRFEERVQMQPPSAFGLEAAERVSAIGVRPEVVLAEMTVETLEERQLEACDRGVIHELCVARRLQRRLKLRRAHARQNVRALARIAHRFDVDIEHVQKKARRRAVRTRVRGIVRKQSVQGIHADHAGAAMAPLLDDRAQVREIAHAPVALRAQRIELQRRSPYAAAAGEGRGQIAALRSDHE